MKTISFNVAHYFLTMCSIFSLCLSLSFAQGTPTATTIPTPTVTATTTVIATPTPQPPTVTTGEATVDYGGEYGCLVTLSGAVSANGLQTTAWFEYGTVSSSYSGTSSTQIVSGTQDTTISIDISVPASDILFCTNGQIGNIITYYFRIVAQNSASTSYGSEKYFENCYYLSVADCFGCTVSGGVTDATTGKGIKDATILIDGVKQTVTDKTGYYNYDSRDYDHHDCFVLEVKVSANGYISSTKYGDSEVCECDTTLNFKLQPISKNSIYGYILDKYNNPIESAKIRLKGITAKHSGESVSDADGYFEFTNIKKGKYFIYVSKKGYKKYKKKIELREGKTKEVEVILKDK